MAEREVFLVYQCPKCEGWRDGAGTDEPILCDCGGDSTACEEIALVPQERVEKAKAALRVIYELDYEYGHVTAAGSIAHQALLGLPVVSACWLCGQPEGEPHTPRCSVTKFGAPERYVPLKSSYTREAE